MDIKSKNSNYRSEWIAAGIIIAAVLLFLMQYESFAQGASQYREENDTTEEIAINKLMESNYVFYRDIREKVDQTSYTYEDLYMRDTVIQPQGEETNEEEANENEASHVTLLEADTSLKETVAQWKQEQLRDIGLTTDWEEYAESKVSTLIDYCVIDNETGVYIKNTGNALETLGTEEEAEELPYVYYIKVAYDGAGHMGNVAVRSDNADKTLKLVQSLIKQNRLAFNSQGGIQEVLLYQTYDESTYRYMTNYVDIVAEAPKNVTFIYAITPAQWKAFGSGGLAVLADEAKVYYGGYAYYAAGVVGWYRMLLYVMAAAALLLHCRRYRVPERKIYKLPLEIVCAAAWCVRLAASGIVLDMVYATAEGQMQEQIALLFPHGSDRGITLIINAAVLALIFAVWYACFVNLCGLCSLGIRRYVAERSLLYKFWQRTKNFWIKKWKQYKSSMLDIELSKNNTKALRRIVLLNFVVLCIISCLWMFGIIVLLLYSAIVYWLAKKYMNRIQRQYRKLLEASRSIAKGNLQTALNEDWGIFESYKEELSKIQEGFRVAVDEEVKSQRMKTELITNVSHDLKTPLTAMITYIDLLKDPEITPEEQQEYIAILERKSLRLKILIEDLFEISKANSKNVSLDIMDVDIVGLMKQVSMEFEEKMTEANLELRWDIPDEKIILPLDGQKTYRIFENLYTNIIKYAMPATRVFIKAEREEGGVRIELKNISAAELPADPMELTERFVRGDVSRNTEGSGLGLAIAKSFAELQKGRMTLETDGDLFKVILQW